MKHQLKPSTYTICESTEQCKELFEWADKKGLINSGAFYLKGEDMLYIDKDGLLYSCCLARYLDPANKPKQTLKKIPLPEFISRLKGEWDGKTVTLSEKLMTELKNLLQDEAECGGNEYAAEILSTIKEQLNNQ